MNPRDVFKRALQDPPLKGIDYIGSGNYANVAEAIRDLPGNAHISEWRHSLGEVRYEYHVHINGIQSKLQNLYETNRRGGNPRLTRIYSKKELEQIIQSAQEVSHS